MKDRRIHGAALESIMRDVLEGIQDLACDASAGCTTGELTVLSVERPEPDTGSPGRIIPFPARRPPRGA